MMENRKKNGFFLAYAIGCFICCIHYSEAEVKTVSACHGTTSTTCHYITLECNLGSSIRLLSMKYGVKDNNCNDKRNRCLDPNKDGCCAYSSDDCMDYYSDLHAYNLFKVCSGKQRCGPMPVPNKVLESCDGRTSTYAYITYECVQDAETMRFCRVDNFDNVKDTHINVLFSKAEDSFPNPTNCSCFVTSDSNIFIDYVDVRMIKDHTSDQGSDCSTSQLTTVPDDGIKTQCDNGVNEENNFIKNALSPVGKFIELKLLNLYLSNEDAPQFVWLDIYADGLNDVNVQCFKHADHSDQSTPIPPFTTSSSTDKPANSTDSQTPLTNDEDSNTGAIVAGVLVPVLLLVVALVVILLLKRRGYLCKKEHKHAMPNKYTDRSDIENSVDNSEYAEIGFVPDSPVTGSPNINLRNGKSSQELNGHTYQNVGNKDMKEGKQSKNTKWPLNKLKSHTDRLISFFRNQTENDFPPVKNRDRENSTEAYDHLKRVSANSAVQVEVAPPVDEQTHTYSHTSDESVKRQLVMNQEKDGHNNKPNTEEISAFHVGDSYIEFQFGAVDKDHPDLVKHPNGDTENNRPAPPSRPPPSPKSATNLDKTPKSSPKQTRLENENRSKTPNSLTPGHINANHSPNYDYAAGAHKREQSISSRGSDASDISDHSYKVLEKQQVYDYADVSDDELGYGAEGYTSGSIYEDVDKDPRSLSVRKHKSAADVPQDTNEYLEPLTSRSRVKSSPSASAEQTDNPNTKLSAASMLRKELKQKTQQNTETKGQRGETSHTKNPKMKATGKLKDSDDSGAVRSDNVDTKDYQKVDGVKGVLNMAKMFENKESDSDSSRQSSPRNIQVTNFSGGNNQKIKKTCSDA